MSEICYLEEYANLVDTAYEEFKIAYDREPTEEELEHEIEALKDRYRK